MLYSSGTTGRPKGVLRPLPDQPPDEPLSALAARLDVWRFREGQVYLSPAPLYHSAPLAGVGGTIRRGGAVVVMERFDASSASLSSSRNIASPTPSLCRPCSRGC